MSLYVLCPDQASLYTSQGVKATKAMCSTKPVRRHLDKERCCGGELAAL